MRLSKKGDKGKWKEADKGKSTEEDQVEMNAVHTGVSVSYNCHTAKTSLLLPFKWSPTLTADDTEWIDKMLDRSIPGPTGPIQLWQQKFKLPEGVADLVGFYDR
eukprot:TRINITY_DN8802_c0_g1_i2.p1 TRINITY_DN8802_c0_g1~~TRINITY_DN8802_c0_g1_i2.p1  ORF type:complete len:104 (-),score=21.65 TRINITY_DN8802_c0_g1_i2:11-322(-)